MRSFLLLFSVLSLSCAQDYQTISFVNPQTSVQLAASLIATGDPTAPYNVELLPLGVNADNQQWLVTDPDGFITNKAQPGYALDVYGYSSTPGTAVDVWNKKNAGDTSDNQQWTLNPDGSISSFLGNNLYLTPVFATNRANSGTLSINTLPTPVTTGDPPVTPQVCISFGDPHVSSFSAYPYSNELSSPGVEAPGVFVLAILGGTYVYSGLNTCGVSITAYCNFNASVKSGNNSVVVAGDLVTVNKIPITVSGTTSIGQINITRLGASHYIVYFPEGYLNVIPNPYGFGVLDLTIVVTSAPAPYGGLCGSYPAFTTLFGFIQAWQVHDDSYEQRLLASPPSFSSMPRNVTTSNQTLLNLANTICSPLLSGTLVQQCAGILDASLFYQACHDDVILTGSAGFGASSVNAFSYKCAVTAPAGTTIILPTSALNTIASGPGIAANIDEGNTAIGFSIQARNALDNSVGSGGDTWTITSTGPTNLGFNITDLQNGNYNVTYIPSTVGLYVIAIKDGINHIFGSPFLITINTVGNNLE